MADKNRAGVRHAAVLLASCAGALGLAPAFATPAAAKTDAMLPLVPYPAFAERHHGAWHLAAGTAISVPAGDVDAASAARLLITRAKSEHALSLVLVDQGADVDAPHIRFIRDKNVQGAQAYHLTVDRSGATIAASARAGFVYGAMTLDQLLGEGASRRPVRVPFVTIRDTPRFAWRGLMIDTARHFQPIESLYAIIDQMVDVKLNVLHLHLTDDQGWRFEVKRYPKLTQVGAWREGADTGHGNGPRTGGFYTQDQLKALVGYAAQRGITVVPEIDLPGHAQALVAAYPDLGILHAPAKVSHDWGINPYLFNPGPKGMAFIENVLDELMAVFPSKYIHLGGDEAVKDQWERSPAVQAQMRGLGIKTENGLQSWMIEQLGRYLSAHGRRLIGWDEILEGGIPPSASVMSWRGEQGAIDAANAGHDVVLSPSPQLYLDNLQSNLASAPAGRGFVQTLEDIYRYDPMPKGIDPAKAGHVMGVQANAWSEYLVTPWQMQHKLFPRAGALAEDGWSPRVTGKKDYAAFLARLEPQIRRWKQAGVEVADDAFAVTFTPQQPRGVAIDAAAKGGQIFVSLASQSHFGVIRYTLDGAAPTAKSKRYSQPLAVTAGTVITASSFAADGAMLAAPRDYDTGRAALLTTTNGQMAACPGEKLWLRLPLDPDSQATGPAYNINIFNPCQADEHAPLRSAKTVTVSVVRLARNFGLAHDIWTQVTHYPTSAHGELVVSMDCNKAAQGADAKDRRHDPLPGAPVLASWALPDPRTAPQRFQFTARLPADLPMTNDAKVCFQFTEALSDPLYSVDKVVWSDRAQ